MAKNPKEEENLLTDVKHHQSSWPCTESFDNSLSSSRWTFGRLSASVVYDWKSNEKIGNHVGGSTYRFEEFDV